MDDEDEKWVIKQRRDHRQKGMMSQPVAPNLLYFPLVTFSCPDYFIITLLLVKASLMLFKGGIITTGRNFIIYNNYLSVKLTVEN